MMQRWIAFLATGAALIAAGPAWAQADDDGDDDDDAGYSIPYQAADNYSGLHVEAAAGFDNANFKSYKASAATTTATTSTAIPAAYASGSQSAVNFGGSIGYDFAVSDHLTLGAEFGVTDSTLRWTNTGNLVNGTFNTQSVRLGTDIFFGPRIGWAFSARTRAYGKINYTGTHYGINGSDGSEVLHEGITATGLRLGVGVEHKLTRSLYVKGEFDYSRNGSGSINYSGTTPDASTFDLRSTRQQLSAGLGWHF